MTAVCGPAFGGEAPRPAAKDGEIKAVTVPDRKIPEPEKRGKKYPVPATKWKMDPVLWGWTCELPDGSGLAFGGVDQVSEDGRPHTRIKVAGTWQPIIDELRKKNPLQKRFVQIRQLRNDCKDTLAKARHIYFEGKTADEEAKLIKADVDPAVEKLIKDLAALIDTLKAPRLGDNGLGVAYERGQKQFALKHLAAAARQIKPFGARTTPEQMATMRRAQIELELGGEALDAEPPPRALSQIAFEPKTKLFVIFGGEHMDYVTNDLWVFDPAKRRWFQRHPASAPEPRGDHHFDALGDGRIAMRGGYYYGRGYVHAGPARWIYDVKKNAWAADGHQEKALPADTRSPRYWPPSAPEHFMKGARPDAAANEAKLKALPVNTWVRMKTLRHAGGREWGTWAHDSDRDMLYVYAGGHASYPGNDVARYHLATDRWELSDPIEVPLGCAGTNEQYPSGFNFNRRPWVKRHVWNGLAYDPGLKKMVLGSVNTNEKYEPYFYLYDPDKADWASRHRLAKGMGNNAHHIQLRHTKHGMFAWYGGGCWLLDAKALAWRRIAVKGKVPGTVVDGCGLVYDSKRDRMLLTTLGGYAKPYDGQIYAVDMKTRQMVPLNPEGLKALPNQRTYLREVAYHPASDLFIWISRVRIKGKVAPDLFPAYDASKNRWVTVKLPLGAGKPFDTHAVNMSVNYDARRGLFWVGDAGWNGGVWVLRFDAAKAEIKPLKGAAPAPAGKGL
jgi:galactose oxidase-like protein